MPRPARFVALLLASFVPACVVMNPKHPAKGGDATDADDAAGGKGGVDTALQKAVKAEEDLRTLARKDQPIPDDKIAELETLGAAVPNPKQVAYAKYMADAFRREAAWRGSDADAAKAIAQNLGGEVTLSGTKTGAKLALPFKAKKGVCYTAFLRFQTTGKSDMGALRIDYPGNGSTPLQGYSMDSPTRPERGEWIVGACATDDVQATLGAEVSADDPGNGVRYLVIATPKASFPLAIATYMQAKEPDTCDTEAIYRFWTDPIPGALAYKPDGEPILITETLAPGRYNGTFSAIRPAGYGYGLGAPGKKKELVTAPPAQVTFPGDFN